MPGEHEKVEIANHVHEARALGYWSSRKDHRENSVWNLSKTVGPES